MTKVVLMRKRMTSAFAEARGARVRKGDECELELQQVVDAVRGPSSVIPTDSLLGAEVL